MIRVILHSRHMLYDLGRTRLRKGNLLGKNPPSTENCWSRISRAPFRFDKLTEFLTSSAAGDLG
jgi:hypothetical protein